MAALPFGFGAQMQMDQSRAARPKQQPAPATPPQSTEIAGTTYVNVPQQQKSPWSSLNPTANRVVPRGLHGADGSIWRPMQAEPTDTRQPANPFDMGHAMWLLNNQGGGDVPRVPGISDADRTAAESKAFGRAKDRIGKATQGLLRSVQNQFAGRGLMGSGLERDAEMEALEAGNAQIGEVIRDQAIEGLRRQNEVADQTYQGDITQRGQDLNALAQRKQSMLALLKLAEMGGGAY